MRTQTALFWLGVIVLFALFGAAFLKFVAIAIGLALLLLFATLLLGAWMLKRRMNRKLQEMQRAFQAAQADAQARHAAAQQRRDAIDVEPVDVRDDR